GASITRTRTGATISYSLSEAATTTFTVDLMLPGAKPGHSCVKASRRNHRSQRCTRDVPIRGHFAHASVAGTTRLHFTGRINGRALRRGSYRLNATPRNLQGTTGHTAHAPFRIVS